MKPLEKPPGLSSALLLAGVCLLTNCATPPPVSLPPGTRWQEVAKVAGTSTVAFSYQTNDRKYDLVRFQNAATPVVFEDGRLLAVVPQTAMADWDRRVTQGLPPGQPPFAAGIAPLHAWVTALRQPQPPAPAPKTSGPGDVAEAAACGVILAPIAPILLAGSVCAGAEYAMTGSDRARAQAVNDALLETDASYRGFLAQLPKPLLETTAGAYHAREYYVVNSAFSATKYFYDVGILNGRVQWVSYESDPIRQHAFAYWKAHRPH